MPRTWALFYPAWDPEKELAFQFQKQWIFLFFAAFLWFSLKGQMMGCYKSRCSHRFSGTQARWSPDKHMRYWNPNWVGTFGVGVTSQIVLTSLVWQKCWTKCLVNLKFKGKHFIPLIKNKIHGHCYWASSTGRRQGKVFNDESVNKHVTNWALGRSFWQPNISHPWRVHGHSLHGDRKERTDGGIVSVYPKNWLVAKVGFKGS